MIFGGIDENLYEVILVVTVDFESFMKILEKFVIVGKVVKLNKSNTEKPLFYVKIMIF